ncbi:hypothetical protein GCM10014715_72290 [Streptomyces spiralis]|uniref:HTH asnC-type domain-containing protein n=1 Tax=Streptomyces spiralis TaxID=66376 RepID=A0A919E2U5_9ACTN|nr:Lrp/AsnC family transcriptional regulator [Streptomyces spiralis]GHF05730.1 hypothetical protein GCM10014715_72290 [Streptomyces spiralis]
MPMLDDLDLRIIAALQINGRASWRAIAQALRLGERTVARRGARLLESGTVRVTGLENFAETVVIRVHCAPGLAPQTAAALAERDDVVFSSTVTGTADVVAEHGVTVERLRAEGGTAGAPGTASAVRGRLPDTLREAGVPLRVGGCRRA